MLKPDIRLELSVGGPTLQDTLRLVGFNYGHINGLHSISFPERILQRVQKLNVRFCIRKSIRNLVEHLLQDIHSCETIFLPFFSQALNHERDP